MNFLHAMILGIVEGLTEFLPVSSTAHLVLAAKILGLTQTEFIKTFEITIQAGAILAVIFLYAKRLLAAPKIWAKVMASFIPTAVIGYFLYHFIKKYFLAGETVILISLLIGGIVIILFERFYHEKESAEGSIADLPWRTCILIGFFQAFSMIPGVSRAAATILGALFLGVKRRTAVEFSFFLAVPTILAAAALDILKSGLSLVPGQAPLIAVGFVSSFIVAMLTIRLFIFYFQKNNLTFFGIYRILASLLFFFFMHS